MSKEAVKKVGLAKTGISGALKLGQLTDLIGKGVEYGGGAGSAMGGTVPYAGMAAAAAWVAKNIITGNDYVDRNHPMRQAMQGAGALLSMTPAWPAGIALGLGSMLIGEDNPEYPKLFLSGGEDMKWGDEGLSHEGILWDKWSTSQVHSPELYIRSEDYLRDRIADQIRQAQFNFENYPGAEPKTYEQRLAEYNAFSAMTPIERTMDWRFQQQRYYDWGVVPSSDHYERMPVGRINPHKDWIATGYLNDRPITGRENPIQSGKWGDLYSEIDLITQGAPFLGIEDLYGGDFAKENYSAFRESINQVVQGHLDVFNENIVAHLDTLSEADRGKMLEKLNNTNFRIDYQNPNTQWKNVQSGRFEPGSTDILPNFLTSISKIVSKQLIDQTTELGIPKSAFMADAETNKAMQNDMKQIESEIIPGQTTNKGSTMADTREGQYVDYAKQQQGWEWGSKYDKTLEAYLRGDVADVQNPGEGYTAIPVKDWQNMANFAKGIDPMDSDTWQGGTGGGVSPDPQQQAINDYIEGYDWNDYWQRLEDRATGLGQLYGSTAERLEDVLGARQNMFQESDPLRQKLVGDTAAQYNKLQAEYDALKSGSPDIAVSLGGQTMLNMGQKLGSKRNLLDNIARQTQLRESTLGGLESSRDAFLSRWKGDLGDITSMYQSGLNAPVTSYQEMAPHMTRWEGYDQEGIKRSWLAEQAALDRASKMDIARMVQEGQDASWADIMGAIGAGGGTLAQLLGIKTGKDSNVLTSVLSGLKSAGSGIASLFSGDNFDTNYVDWGGADPSWLDSMDWSMNDWDWATSWGDAWDAF